MVKDVDRAEAVLTAGEREQIESFASALGYADLPHLIRDFARVTGMTPGEFAALHSR